MQKLDHATKRCLDAAEGWRTLGNPDEAMTELAGIDSSFDGHPTVLMARWDTFAQAKRWDEALRISTALVELERKNPEVWILHANTVRVVRGDEAALRTLESVAGEFPRHPIVRYNLACYQCSMGNVDLAEDFLGQAFSLPDGGKLRKSAQSDPDLKSLWAKIPHIKNGE